MLKELNQENFENETKSGLKLIEFYTTWCGYCQKQLAELKNMDKIWIGQVEADNNSQLASRYRINAYPTFILLNNGKEADRFSGFRKKEDIMEIILKHM